MLKSFAAYAVIAAVAIGASLSMAGSEPEQPAYLDDRSTPEQLVLSYFNAIDRGEHARAYGYFGREFTGSFDSWRAQFKDVTRTAVSFGQMTQEGAAGAIYYQLPVAVDLQKAGGEYHLERGCIALRLAYPAQQERPPFEPLHILDYALSKDNGRASFAPARCDSAPLPTR